MLSRLSTLIHQGFLRLRRRRVALGALAAIVVLAAAGVIALLVILGDGEGPAEEAATVPPTDWQRLELPSEPPEPPFEMTAAEADDIGIEPDTEFVLTSEDEVDADFVESRLEVEPAVRLTVEETDGHRFRIVPSEPLQPGRMYHFSLVETSSAPRILASWAFETKSPIRVVQTLPGDQTTQVPLNTGIELTFSHDGVQDVEGHFEIDPPVEGRFEVHKRVVVFLPEGLTAGTLYTVTVRAGLGVSGSDDVMADDFVFQFETGETERTGDVPQPAVFDFTRKVAEASTQEAPTLAIYTSERGETTIPIQVYRYPDVEALLAALEEFQDIPSWASISRESFLAETADLEPVAAFEAAVQRLSDYGDAFVSFPEPLPEGFYLVEAQFEGRAVQSWLQVTDVASYVSLSSNKTLVWVNDLATKGPLAGAQLELLGTGVDAVSDDEGIASFDTPAELVSESADEWGYVHTETSGNLLVTAPDGRSAVVPLGPVLTRSYRYYGYRTYGYHYAGDEYWHHISTDRPLYLPTDTVHFWGVARRRENPPASETLTVELTGSSYLDYYHQPVTIAETEVRTSSLGTFSGELTFEGLSPGYYQLTVKTDGQRIDSTSVPVETYTKPAYKIDVVPSRQAVFDGEQVDFAISASFFEGSPVPQLRLRYETYDRATGMPISGELTTDEEGNAAVSITARADSTSYPSSSHLNVVPVLAEEGEIAAESWVSVHPASLTISASSNLEGDQGVIEGTVHHVDLSPINEGTAKGYDDYLGDPAGGVAVSGRITEVSWERREVGQYYDFVAKIVRKSYEYDRIETPLGTFTAMTDAAGGFRYAFPLDEEKYYEIDLSVTDDAGQVATQEVSISGSRSLFNAGSDMVQLTPPGGSSGYGGGRGEYALGDEVVLEMRRGADLLPVGGDDRYLFYQAQNGLREYAVQADSTLRFTFDEGDVPSITVLGVWFSGYTYQEVRYGYMLRFDPAERELEIQLTPDQELYEPGDSATVDVLVSDPAGRPQADAEVNLAVVDEAIFYIEEAYSYNQDVLEALYESVEAGVLQTYASHQYPVEEPQAERGGGDGARREFADVVFFGEVTTGPDGRASVSFDLPDNLTSWRITAQGVTADLKAGTTLGRIPVGLPFFVDVAMNDEYLTVDRPAIKLRSFGRALEPGQDVTFEVTAPTLGLTEPVRATAPAFQAARVSLPELSEGEHEILIAASAGEMRDSLVRTVRVVPSRLEGGEARFYELEEGLEIEGSTERPTRLVFSDHERGRYFSTLRRLTWGHGDRVDQMLARDLAAELLEGYFEEVEARGEEFDASLYQTSDGGIALFPYADDELILSARVAALAPERVGRNALTAYFLGITEDRNETRERAIIALYGLAALGEPVLVSIDRLLEEDDLTWRERLYLGLAALELGDDISARAVYRGLLEEYGESRAPFARLRVGADQDDILEATSLAAILGAGLGDEFAPALFDYTTNNYTEDILIELEQISYLAQALPRLSPEPVRFAYTLEGERREVTLERGGTFALQVTPEQLADLEVEPLEGQVGVAASFTAPLEPADIVLDPDIGVSRLYAGAEPEGVVVEEGELVRITLDYVLGPQSLAGCYQISDLLPSGLKAVTRTGAWDLVTGVSYPYRIEGQRVSFCVWKDATYQPIVYYARVVSTGEYTAEPAIIQSMKSAESVNLSNPDQVEVR